MVKFVAAAWPGLPGACGITAVGVETVLGQGVEMLKVYGVFDGTSIRQVGSNSVCVTQVTSEEVTR